MAHSRTARVVVFHGAGQPVQVQEYEIPKLGEDEVLVRVVCSTLCGSDIHTFTGKRSTPCPTVLGHEILGRIVQLPASSAMTDLRGLLLEVGDRVTWAIAASCGVCFFCQNGLPQKCVRLFKYGHESIEKTNPFNGGLAEYCLLVPGTSILKVPELLPDDVACPVNCATATVAAALRYAGDCQDRAVLLLGAGMLGLTATAMARSRGAREVIVTDISDDRLIVAKEFGATKTVNVASQADLLHESVLECTDGRGADIAIELTGAGASVESSLVHLRVGGKCLWVGSIFPSPPLPIAVETVVRKMIQIQGVHNYTPQDLVDAMDFLSEWGMHYPFQSLVGKSFLLADTQAAFQYAMDHNVFRVAVQPKNLISATG